MGNCQAIDAATLVIQHPSGRVERLYWPVTASEVMRSNPGHYVALIITLCLSEEDQEKKKIKDEANGNGVRVTRVKLLKPADLLVLGQAYRLITSQEVMKGLWEKKYNKMKKKESQSRISENQRLGCEREPRKSESEATKQEKQQQRTKVSSTSARSRPWRPSLQSISEAGFVHPS